MRAAEFCSVGRVPDGSILIHLKSSFRFKILAVVFFASSFVVTPDFMTRLIYNDFYHIFMLV